jgi:hypothetical protein
MIKTRKISIAVTSIGSLIAALAFFILPIQLLVNFIALVPYISFGFCLYMTSKKEIPYFGYAVGIFVCMWATAYNVIGYILFYMGIVDLNILPYRIIIYLVVPSIIVCIMKVKRFLSSNSEDEAARYSDEE